MDYITRKYKQVLYDDNEQLNPNFAFFDNFKNKLLDQLYLSDDSEWESPIIEPDEVGTRKQKNIISHQYMAKLPGYPVIGYILFREENDKPFTFWDMLSVVKQYLNDIEYDEKYTAAEIKSYAKKLGKSINDIKRNLFSTRIPPILITGYFGGVDVSAYSDWYKYIDNGKNDANVILLYKQAFFTQQFTTEISSPDRHRKVPVTLQYRDTMSLGPQGGLKKLGEMVNQPKIDTTVWDKEDGKPAGFYKSHMRDLLKSRPSDYQSYAMTDAEITLKYLGFFLRIEQEAYDDGLLKQMYIPATITGLSDQLTAYYLEQPYSRGHVRNLSRKIFGEHLEQYIRPEYYNELPTNDEEEWEHLIFTIRNTKRKSVREKHQMLIKKLVSFLARSSIVVELEHDGQPIQLLDTDKLLQKINFKKLYELNPKLKIEDLFNKNKRLRYFHPKLEMNDEEVSAFNSLAYQFNRKKSNELLTFNELVNYLWNKSVYKNYYERKSDKYKCIKADTLYWLSKKVNFFGAHNGYHFIEANNYSSKHKKGVHDMITLQADEAYNQAFSMALKAYSGGQNLCYNPGIIKMPYIYDIDLKSSYVNAGHLIPGIRLDVPAFIDEVNINKKHFIHLISKFPNGLFTVGVADIDYELPKEIRRAPVGVKAEIKGAMPCYVLEHKRAPLTVTKVIDLIKHGASIYIHRLIIPEQKILNGNLANIYPSGKAQDWTLQRRNLAKKKYGKNSAEQELFKLLGNGNYGKTAQGLNAKTEKEFGTDKSYYIPVSKSTNPLISMQYSSIAEYQVNFLMELIDRLYPHNLIPSVTTDGFIWVGNQALDKEKIVKAIRDNAPKQWVIVNDKYFDGKFFEFKSKLSNDTKEYSKNTILVNLKTRFNFTLDGRIKALAGIRNVAPESIYRDLINGVTTIKVDQHRLSRLDDMKHRVDNKHLLSEWQQPEYQSLSFDFTSRPTSFHDNGDGYGYYNTEPFRTVEEAETFKENIKPYGRLFPLFNTKFAYAFLELDNHLVATRTGYKIAWIKNDVPLKGNNYLDLVNNYQNDYKWKVLLRYLAKYESKYDLKMIYNNLFLNRYNSFSGFKQAIKRAKGKFINPLVELKENWPEKLRNYETRC
ncbi:hypothetical protein [Limosilactobacillus reuteri]|uniref:hypothetical protein n=1 Tax=Limosilactobacillus reuteri TaxID=1598 RepID=UPI00128DDC13|nr:hypothetical protein [Limosilactobacillus reuteri]MQB60005.1 hypothetical protein [Limosilactobacillus reuteri]MQB83401.1 hypothetical protein [Limosilactobacillus reuteri]